MADLGNLWFSLGLDDSKFEKEWKAAFAKYQQQQDIQVGIQIDPNDKKQLDEIGQKLNAFANNFSGKTKAKIDIKVSSNTIAALKSLKELGGTKAEWAAVREAAKAMKEASRAVNQLSKEEKKASTQTIGNQKKITEGYKNQALWVQNLSSLVSNYFSLYAIKNFATEIATVTGEFEKQRVTLQAMIGEMEGLEIFREIKELAVASPFEFKDLASYAKQLAAFSIPYEELFDTTKRLADISAGLGVDMSRIILAYGQIKSAGVLKGTELRQLTEAGVPILEKLAEKFEKVTGKAVSMGDIFDKVSQKAISFEMVKDVLDEMTSAGGKFYKMQEIQAETLSGKISNLKDAYAIMLTEIGEKTDGILRGGVEALYKLIDNWESLGRVVISVATAFGTLQAVRITQWAAAGIIKISEMNYNLVRLYREARQTEGTFKSLLSTIAKANGWAVILTALAGVITYFVTARQEAKVFNEEMEKMLSTERAKYDEEIADLDRLSNAIFRAKENTKERRVAIEEYNSRFGQYLNNLHEEVVANEAIAESNKQVAASLVYRHKEQALLQAKSKVEDTYGRELESLEADYIKELKKANLGGISSYAIAAIKEALQKNPELKSVYDKEVMDKLREKLGTQANNAAFRFEGIFKDYAKAFKEYTNVMTEAVNDVDNKFKESLFSTLEKEELFKQYTEEHNKAMASIAKDDTLTKDQISKKEKDERINYLTKLTELFKEMPFALAPYQQELKKLKETEDSWRDTIAKDVEKLGLTAGFAPKEDDSYPKYIERLREEWKNINESIEKYNGKDIDGGLKTLKAEKDALTKLANLWGFVLDPKKNTKDAKTKEKERINALKEESQWVLKLYESYKKYLGQDLTSADAKKNALADFIDIPEKIKSSFEKDADISEWFRAEWSKIAEDAKSSGSDIGEALANALLLKLGTINTGEVLESLKLGEKIQKELEKWGLGDFVLMGEGAALDLSKIARDYAVTDNEIAAKKKELLNQVAEAEKGNDKQIAALKEKYGEDWEKKARERIERLTALEKDNNRKIAEDKVYDLAKTLAKEDLENTIPSGFLQSLGDKSTEQLKEMQSQLAEMATDIPEFIFSNQFTDQFTDLNIDWDKFIEKYQEYIKLQGKDVSDELLERKREELHDLAGAISETIGVLKELAGEDSAWGGFLSGLDDGAKAAISISEAFTRKKDKDGNLIGGLKGLDVNWTNLASAVAGVVTSITSAIIESKRYQEEMERAGNAFSASIIQSKRDIKIAGEEFNTIFGEDLIGALQADQEAITSIITDLKRGSKEVANIKILTKKGIFGIGRKETTLKDLAPQLFKADGSVNYEYLDGFLSAYGDKLDDAQKTILENLKATYEQYEDAMGDINDYLSNIFSDTASTIADRMIEAFAATGDAATDLGDLVNNVAKQMAKDLIQSLLIDKYLQPAIDRVNNIYNPDSAEYEADPTRRIQKSILALQEGMAAVNEGAAEVNQILQGLADYGIDFGADSENASQVLSGLTEDQQNLLMGYINGIRADVSYNKGLMLNIVNSVGDINNNIATALIVWKQIEANTHRSADGVDKIIGYFESVTGPYDGGGGQAFRVNIA